MLHVLRRNKYREIQLKSKDANQAYYHMAKTIWETSQPTFLYKIEMERCVNRTILYNEMGVWRNQYFPIYSHLIKATIKKNYFRSKINRWNKVVV